LGEKPTSRIFVLLHPLTDASESAFDTLTRAHALEFDRAAIGTRVLLPDGFFTCRARFHPEHGGRRRLRRIPSGYTVKITPDANIGTRHAKIADTFDFAAIPSLNKPLVLELGRCEYLVARENVIALGNSGTGKTHVCLALGLAACQRGFPVAVSGP
jgi:hypothetical protein